MTPLDAAMHTALSGDSALVALLSSYRSAPAIFFQSPLPQGVNTPYVSVSPVEAISNDTKNGLGRDVVRTIGCYAAANGDTRTVDAMAERVRALFHRQPLTITGYETMLAEVTGPSDAPTDKTLYGRALSVRLVIWNT